MGPVRLLRVYDAVADPPSGSAYLVDRLWPRGVAKSALRLDGWLREVAPSTELRRWIHADEARWPEFVERYRAELDGADAAALLEAVRSGPVTLLYAARNTERNHAVVLRDWLAEHA